MASQANRSVCLPKDPAPRAPARAIELTVPAEAEGLSVRAALLRGLKLSGSRLRSLAWTPGAILLDGVPARVTQRVCAGQALTVRLTERRAPSPNAPPCALGLDIVFEDADLLAIDKPAGLSMHDRTGASLAGAVRAYLGGDSAAHFVNRLDRGTSGLLLAAKNGYMHDRLRALLHTGALYREYRAVAEGRVEPSSGVIALPLGAAEGEFYRRTVRPDGKPARTEYEVLDASEDYSLLRLVPRTGRTHQLRVHLSALGHPLAGDALYGASEDGPIARPALHSYFLRFAHPLTGEVLSLTAPPPEELCWARFGPEHPPQEGNRP